MPADSAPALHVKRQKVNREFFNPDPLLVHELRIEDFHVAMQDIYDFFFDVNKGMEQKGLPRLEETIRKAILSGTISDMLTVSMAKHARSLVKNQYPNGSTDSTRRREPAPTVGSERRRSPMRKRTRRRGGDAAGDI